MSQKNNSLEVYIANKLKKLDKYARPTRGSGAAREVEDAYNKLFVIEAKQKHTKENIVLDYKIWKKLVGNVPIGSLRIPFYVTENKHMDKFAIVDLDTFFQILYKAYGVED